MRSTRNMEIENLFEVYLQERETLCPSPFMTSTSMWSLVFPCFVVTTLYLECIFNYLVHGTNIQHKS